MIFEHREYRQKNDNYAMWQIIMLMIAIIYPMMVSMYVVLPLFIGLAGYFMIDGILNDKKIESFISFLYLTNLDLNTSVPVFSGVVAVLLCYLVVLPYASRITSTCKTCTNILTVISVYIVYFVTIFIFDFIVDIDSHNASLLILMSVLVDILLVSLL